ncbi:CoA pyrophosphatase [Glaciecola sp. 1036]|uniref:CoA pyrophosphatase n=1 Tax=Alteromonadaceae TaxID=72275 RepID=UPI003D047056
MTESEFIYAFNQPWRIKRDAGEPFPHAKRPAAVLICLNPVEEVSVILTVRARHLKHHAGQISFPGGKVETFDKNLVDTACREAREEIGLSTEQLRIIGAMPSYPTISGFAVTPIIASLQKPIDISETLTIDTNEVEEVFEVPLRILMDPQNYFVHEIERDNQKYPVYYIPHEGKTIWGATAGILAHLRDHVNLYKEMFQR